MSVRFERLGRTGNGKDCIRFGRLASVDSNALATAIRDAFAWAGAQDRESGRQCTQPVGDA